LKNHHKGRARDLAQAAPQERPASEIATADESSSALRVRISEKNGVPEMHAHVQLMEALGTTDPDFLDSILCQLFKVGTRDGRVDERALNFLLSVIKGVKPRDQVEALLAAQMPPFTQRPWQWRFV
jgi:hypothetical protein